MDLSALRPISMNDQLSMGQGKSAAPANKVGADTAEVREKFDTFVGEAFYGQLLKAMHKGHGKPAYFHGGKAEEAFQGQLDQILATKMAETNASDFTGAMFDLYQLHRA